MLSMTLMNLLKCTQIPSKAMFLLLNSEYRCIFDGLVMEFPMTDGLLGLRK
jgi:hypothetical protein